VLATTLMGSNVPWRRKGRVDRRNRARLNARLKRGPRVCRQRLRSASVARAPGMSRDTSLMNRSPRASRRPSACTNPSNRSWPLARAEACALSGNGGVIVSQKLMKQGDCFAEDGEILVHTVDLAGRVRSMRRAKTASNRSAESSDRKDANGGFDHGGLETFAPQRQRLDPFVAAPARSRRSCGSWFAWRRLTTPMPSAGSIAACRATMRTLCRNVLALAASMSDTSSSPSNSRPAGRSLPTISSCSGNSGSRLMPAFAGSASTS